LPGIFEISHFESNKIARISGKSRALLEDILGAPAQSFRSFYPEGWKTPDLRELFHTPKGPQVALICFSKTI
jgi:hypothetical protein